MRSEIEKAFEELINYILDLDLSYDEKIKLLSEFGNMVNKRGQEEIKKIKKDVIYCKKCNSHYSLFSCQDKVEKERKEVCTFWPFAEFDEPKYAEKEVVKQLKICPKGHKIVVDEIIIN